MSEPTVKIEIPLSYFEQYDALEIRTAKRGFTMTVDQSVAFKSGGKDYKHKEEMEE